VGGFPMLVEVSSEVFRNGTISFGNGLNVVLGDEHATNSIGKSSLLMIIDFIFGGETYVSHNKDTISELGHHEFKFKMNFGGEISAFRRDTSSPESVRECDLNYTPINIIPIDDYTKLLKSKYKLNDIDSSFREITSLYSRVWGKHNSEIKRPLQNYSGQKASESLEVLIKLFGKYSTIEPLMREMQSSVSQKDYLASAQKGKYYPKITKTQYSENLKSRESALVEVLDIKNELAKYATNIKEIVNREVLELKVQKDGVLDKKMEIESKLQRITANLNASRHIKSKSFRQLKEFFPDIDVDRLEKVEMFHSSLSRLLKKELEASKEGYQSELKNINIQLQELDSKMKSTVSSVDDPGKIIDRTFGLINRVDKIDREIKAYDTEVEVGVKTKASRDALISERNRILKEIEFILNDEMKELSSFVYSDSLKSPRIKFTDTNYEFEVYEDTGTGKAFSSLLIFDISVFKMTKLPFLIHDSFLFKNIQNTAVSGLALAYDSFDKQSFIAMDEIQKYGKNASEILEKKSVVKLSNESTLFIKDWRKPEAKPKQEN
jgi:hypothetical protein